MVRRKMGSDRQAGFTLIEIIAVLLLLSILAVVAVPKYIDMQEDARNAAAYAAIAEAKSRLSMAYGQYLLQNNGVQPAVADVRTQAGVGADGGALDVGTDFTVLLNDTATGIEIEVTMVNGVVLTTSQTDDWVLPTI